MENFKQIQKQALEILNRNISDETKTMLKSLNCKKLDTGMISFYSWPQIFSSTAGPGGGIGGQMMTSFQFYAFVVDCDRSAAICCCEKWAYIKPGDFEPLMYVKHFI
jgi:hypothetical protein